MFSHVAPDVADAELADVYRDIRSHPELAIVSERLRRLGYETTAGVGRTGVVGVLRNGEGPTAALRADMDALPVLEKSGSRPRAPRAAGRRMEWR